jgi:precorrin-6A synthase
MKKVLVIGIGAGDPDYVTIQAVNALNQVDVFFLLDKGTEKDDLARIRKDICERYIRDPSYRLVEVRDPVRDRSAPSYEAEVASWRDKRAAIFRSLISDEMRDDECGAFLVWGDPSLYDGTLRILQQILAEQPATFEYDVIPGISSIQALAAKHKIALHRVGQAFQVTTGRRLAEGFPNNVEDVVVMLDAESAFRTVDDDVDIYWGAYLGTEDEVLVSGKLRELMDEIERIRALNKAEKGWIMDTYLLRRRPQTS